jgi:FAD:protein FMN transferase
MNRRDFLHPRHLLNVAGPVLAINEELAELSREETFSEDPVILRFARRAMATDFEVLLHFSTPAAYEYADAALNEIDRLEAQLTVYRDTSEVSRLNQRAAHHPVRVEAHLFSLLELAHTIHKETEGAFDISVGALIKAWGFYRRAGRVPSREELAALRERIGMQHLLLDAPTQTVSYQRQGLEINLGSIGKGYALDRAANLLRDGVQNVLMHGGHSSVIAIGNEAPNKTGWTIGLLDPENAQCRRGLLTLSNRAMATSAMTYQHFQHEGRKHGHLLDPRTLWPVEGMLSVTVTAPTAAEADALATAFFILGVSKAREYCEQHSAIGAALISADAPQRMVLLGRAVDEVAILR